MMAEMQIPSRANITITAERRGYQPYGTAKELREKETVKEVIDELSQEINKHKRSIGILRETFGV
jgi:hypothetical protein